MGIMWSDMPALDLSTVGTARLATALTQERTECFHSEAEQTEI